MPALDEAKLEEFMGKMVGDMSAAAAGSLILLGDRLGLYRAIDKHGPVSPKELADKTKTSERYVREWLSAQASMGYVTFDSVTGKFALTPEQAAVFADPDNIHYIPGGFYGIASMYMGEPKIEEAYHTGKGIPWGDHHEYLFSGAEKFFAPMYRTFLVQEWIPSLEGVKAKLEAGGKVADVGCGHGISTLLMAKAFPKSSSTGFDFHDASVGRARKIAAEAGVKNIEYKVATAQNFPGENFDLITFFDCLHDMGDPVGAARQVHKALAPEGAWMVV